MNVITPLYTEDGYAEMADGRGEKDSRGDDKQGTDGANPEISLATRRTGLGPVAKYINEYGGLRKALGGSKEKGDRADAELLEQGEVASAQEYLQWHNFNGKYPQSCVMFCEFGKNSKLRAMFHYLQEREWVLQSDLVRRHDKELVLKELSTVETILIWLVTNLGERED